MFVYQVILLPWILLAFRLASAQNLINVPSVNCCSAPYVLQNGICVLPSSAPCQSNNVIVHVLSGCATAVQTMPCLNQAIGYNAHSQLQPTPCINQQIGSYLPISTLPITSTSPAQPKPGCNQPVTTNNSNQPGVYYPPVQPQSTLSSNHSTTQTPPVQPHPTLCPNLPVTISPPVEVHTTSSSTPYPTTYSPDRQTTIPPPEPLRRCPEGTVLLNGNCRLVYCRSGVPIDGRCVKPRCPTGTTWTGLKCSPPAAIQLAPIYLKTTLINEKSNNLPDVVINNVQNLMVNASITIPQNMDDYDGEYDSKSEEKISVPKCCTAVAPRVCRCQGLNRVWKCYNEKQQICSDLCTSSKVVIAPSKIANWLEDGNELITMPPEFNNNCRRYGNCTQATDRLDCSGCATSQMMSCSPYCYMYRCSSHNCYFYDQQEFCELPQFAKSFGCRPQDGWNR